MNAVDQEAGAEFSEETLAKWRDGVKRRREELFRANWKNRRPTTPLKSRRQEMNFKFVIEWCEDFDEVVGRERERSRLDKLASKHSGGQLAVAGED